MTVAGTSGRRTRARDDLNRRLFFRLSQAANTFSRQVQVATGASPSQGAVLGALFREPTGAGLPFGELIEHLAVSRQNLDAVLKGLESQGFVERVPAPADRRIRIVRLTGKGQEFRAGVMERALAFYDIATRDLSLETRERLAEGLKALHLRMNGLSAPGNGARRRPPRAEPA